MTSCGLGICTPTNPSVQIPRLVTDTGSHVIIHSMPTFDTLSGGSFHLDIACQKKSSQMH